MQISRDPLVLRDDPEPLELAAAHRLEGRNSRAGEHLGERDVEGLERGCTSQPTEHECSNVPFVGDERDVEPRSEIES